MKKKAFYQMCLLLLLLLLILMAPGCGMLDDDDEDDAVIRVVPQTKTITGTAAAGAPIVGYVKVKGVNGNTAMADIDSSGEYSLDVTALTAPYLLVARGIVNGESVRLYSTGVAEGNINITPVTNLITSRIVESGDDAFDSWGTESASVDTTAIQSAEATVQQQLAPILEAYGITTEIDLMGSEFDTDQSGLDAVLDMVDIKIDNANQVMITNKATGNAVTGEEVFSESEGTALVQVISDMAAMNVFWSKLTAVFADESATATELNETIEPLIADDFLEGGRSKNKWLDCVSGWIGAVKFTATIDRSMTSSEFDAAYSKGYWLTVEMGVDMDSRRWVVELFRMAMVYNGSNWLLYGDQRWFGIRINVVADKNVDSDGTIHLTTGIDFDIDMHSAYAYDIKNVRSLILTGPGLPADGLVFQPDVEDEKFNYYNVSSTDGSRVYLLQDDSVISAIPENAEYTIAAYDVSHTIVSLSDTPLITYRSKNMGKPYLNSELSDTIFPIVTSHTTHVAANVGIGTEITFAWTLPADADVGWKNRSIRLDWGNESNDMAQEKFLNLSRDTSVVLDTTSNTITGITWADTTFEGYDVYGRGLGLHWANHL